MERARSIVATLLAIVLLALVYAPVLEGAPRGWALYAYWSLAGLASLVAAIAMERGGGSG